LTSEINKLIKQNDYLGWIPCVIGRLDFSKVCIKQLFCIEKKEHQKAVCFSYQDRHSLPSSDFIPRLNVVSSVQDWKDRADLDKQYYGNFRFITISKTTVSGSMEGTAFLLLDADIAKSQLFVSEVIEPLVNLGNNVREYEKAIAKSQYEPEFILEQQSVDDEVCRIESVIKQFEYQELKDRVISIEYSILSNGLIFIKPVLRKGLYDDPDTQAKVNHTHFIAAKQCFIYVKYSLHTHKHHDKDEDRLTIIHPIDKDKAEETGLRLIGDMERSVIEIKEMGVHKLDASQHYLQGFISYSKSLVESLLEVGLIPVEKGAKKIKFFDNMLQSWRTLIQKHEREEDQVEMKKTKNSAAIGEVFQSLSLLVALFAFLFSSIRWFIPAGKDFQSVYGEEFDFLSIFFDEPIVTSIFLVLCIFTFVVLRIIVNPNGVIRRPLRYFWNFIDKGRVIELVRILLLASCVFLVGRLFAL
jgi:hypothetical protein